MVLGVLRSRHGGGLCSWPILALALFGMAVILAGRDLDLCFDWTSVRRRSLAGTEVVAVPESRPASLEKLLLPYNKVMVESLKRASIRSSLRNPSFFGQSLSFLWPWRMPWPRFGRTCSLFIHLLTV